MRKLSLSALPRIFALAGVVLLSGCVSSGQQSATEPLPINRQAALASVNQFRAQNGLPPLRINSQLMAAAQVQSNAMAAQDRLDHNAGGRLPGRVAAAGYNWSTTAENIGRGYANYSAAMAGWIGSSGHRRNLLNPNVTEIGFAGARSVNGGRNYWTQVFAAPRQAPQPGGVVFTGRAVTIGGMLSTR
ncbi:CAP domain-containing protein [Aureimonas fodinaquatilis]|uniref:CAP domain-containing protein n=1 Tax=Aureimonas fodinaquatilis TaxID=2565783 RepID=A0A5B0E107_9HYPH|nr:CAP domain-containing protein [Aureimonas fodinaquatilis]KAA0971149.1 CAP domain-containing protein [Aureimonas fodinaquatilis]